VVIAVTLLSPGLSGMHRWHGAGTLLVHPSALLAPALLVLAAAQITVRPLFAHGLLATLQVVHILQPDAGQATAFGAAAIALGVMSHVRRWAGVLVLGYAASVVAAWMRPDPLPPAPFVEDIVMRAFAFSPLVGVVAVASFVPFVLAPRLTAHRAARCGQSRAAEVSLIAYFAGTLVAPVFGEFPVPLLGFGPSPVVGAFLGLAALQRLEPG
jgi:cell division protein FtsW (lipid II flippase)